MRSGNLIEAIGNTPLVELPTFSPTPSIRIYAKLEGNNPTGSVKDRIARSMVQAALNDGILSRDKILLEPTSGNTGISLAMVTHRLGYRFTAVMPDNVSVERSQLLSAYGAEIVYSPGDGGSNGSIALAQEMAAADERYVMLYQYGNAANPQAHYETTAPEILRDLPEVTHFVAGLGTGGTLMGVGRRLKEFNPAIEVIAAAPEIDDRIQGLRSLEEGFVPRYWTSRCSTGASWSVARRASRRLLKCCTRRASSPASPPVPSSRQRNAWRPASRTRTSFVSLPTAVGST